MSELPIIDLKHTNYYWVEGERVQFRAEVEMDSFFKVPVAKFIWPDKTIKTVKSRPFTGELVFSDELPFRVEYSSGVWRANIRISI
ncbi:hypothetical protein ZZ1p0134 [Acinetobacter phage ZZ1]|jgi:hypothetical protein|nr:hypothetical protein ZZ1p0134 [Acinetobacter phage ZZ1]AFL47628.2 hypothetical protein ZZ1p0134 [Acinetobacter phage ZZ1]